MGSNSYLTREQDYSLAEIKSILYRDGRDDLIGELDKVIVEGSTNRLLNLVVMNLCSRNIALEDEIEELRSALGDVERVGG